MKKQLEAYELTGKKLATYRTGFRDGNQGDYFPGGLDQAIYDWGHRDGQKYGDRKGKPWTLAELIKLCPPKGGRK
jgi:hypothetical protein